MGAMTGAGIWGLLLSGVPKTDQRVTEAIHWVANHYTWDTNPNSAGYRRYYYYLSMAKALALLDKPTLDSPDGTSYPWAKDLAEKLISLQDTEGSWVNNAMRWMENEKVLATAYAMAALWECRAMLAK